MPNYWDDLWGPTTGPNDTQSSSPSNYWDDLWDAPEPSTYRGLPADDWDPSFQQSEGWNSIKDNPVSRWISRAPDIAVSAGAAAMSAGLDVFDHVTNSEAMYDLFKFDLGGETRGSVGGGAAGGWSDNPEDSPVLSPITDLSAAQKLTRTEEINKHKQTSLSGAASDIYSDLSAGAMEAAQGLGYKYDKGSALEDMKANFPGLNPLTWSPLEAAQDVAGFGSDLTSDLAGMAAIGGPFTKAATGVKEAGSAIGMGMALSSYGDTYKELTKSDDDSRVVAVAVSAANALVQGVVEKIGWDVAVGKTVFGQWFKDSATASAKRMIGARLLLATPTETSEEVLQEITDIAAKRLPGVQEKGWDAVYEEIAKDAVERLPEAAFGGALGGLILGGGSATMERGGQWAMNKLGSKDIAARNAGTGNTPEQQIAGAVDSPTSDEKAKDALITVVETVSGGNLDDVFDKNDNGVLDGFENGAQEIADAAKNATAATGAADEAIKELVQKEEEMRAEISKDLTTADIDDAGTRILNTIEKAGQERGAKAMEVVNLATQFVQWAQGGAAAFDSEDIDPKAGKAPTQMQITPEEISAGITAKATELGLVVPIEAISSPATFDWQGWVQQEVESAKEVTRNGLSEPLQAIREEIEVNPDSPMAQVLSEVPAAPQKPVVTVEADANETLNGKVLRKMREIAKASGVSAYMPNVLNALRAAKGNEFSGLRFANAKNIADLPTLGPKTRAHVMNFSSPKAVVAAMKKQMPDLKVEESFELSYLAEEYAKVMQRIAVGPQTSRMKNLNAATGIVSAMERVAATKRIPGITVLPALVQDRPEIEANNKLTKVFTYTHDPKKSRESGWAVGMPSMGKWLTGELIPGVIAGGTKHDPNDLAAAAATAARREEAAFQVAPQIKSIIFNVWQTGSKDLVDRMSRAITDGTIIGGPPDRRILAMDIAEHVASQGYFVDLPSLLASDPEAMAKFSIAIVNTGMGVMSPWAMERIIMKTGATEAVAKSTVAFLTAMSERWAMNKERDIYEFWDRLGDYAKVQEFLRTDISGLAHFDRDSWSREYWNVKYASEFGKGMLQLFTGTNSKGAANIALHETIHMLFGNNLMYDMLDQRGVNAMEEFVGEKLWDSNGMALEISSLGHERMAVGFEVFILENRAPNSMMEEAWLNVKTTMASYIRRWMKSLGVTDMDDIYIYAGEEARAKGEVALQLKDIKLNAPMVRAYYQLLNSKPDGTEIVYNSPGVFKAMEELIKEKTGIPAEGVFTQASPPPSLITLPVFPKDRVVTADDLPDAVDAANTKWFHGSATETIHKMGFDSIFSNIGLLATGVYTTDEPKLGATYQHKGSGLGGLSKGAHGKGGEVYATKVEPRKVINLEKPLTEDVLQTLGNAIATSRKRYIKHLNNNGLGYASERYMEIKREIEKLQKAGWAISDSFVGNEEAELDAATDKWERVKARERDLMEIILLRDNLNPDWNKIDTATHALRLATEDELKVFEGIELELSALLQEKYDLEDRINLRRSRDSAPFRRAEDKLWEEIRILKLTYKHVDTHGEVLKQIDELMTRLLVGRHSSGMKAVRDIAKRAERMNEMSHYFPLADDDFDSSSDIDELDSLGTLMARDIEIHLRRSGYDAYTHIGGISTPGAKINHRVLVLLDPNSTLDSSYPKIPHTIWPTVNIDVEAIEDDWSIHSGHGPSDTQWRRMNGLTNSESNGTHTHESLLAMQKEREYLEGLAKSVSEAPPASVSPSRPEPKDLSDSGLEEFYRVNVAEVQRGAPEKAMLEAQRALGGGQLDFLLEHIGDLTHRMSEYPDRLYGGYEYVLAKVEKTLSMLTSRYGIGRDVREERASNKAFDASNGKDVSNYDANVDKALKAYSDAHARIPVYNEVQKLARDAAVALGNEMYPEVASRLTKLRGYLKEGPEAWRKRTLEYDGPRMADGPQASVGTQASKDMLKAVAGGALEGEALTEAALDQLNKQVMSKGKDLYGSGDVVDPTKMEQVKDMLNNFLSKMRSWGYLAGQGKVGKVLSEVGKGTAYGVVKTLITAAKGYERAFGSISAPLERELLALADISETEHKRLLATGGQAAVDKRVAEVAALNMGALAKMLNNHHALGKLADKVAENAPKLWDAKLHDFIKIPGARSFNQITTTFNQMAEAYYAANKHKLPFRDAYEFHESVTRDLRLWMYAQRQFELIQNVKDDMEKWEEAKKQWNLDVANALIEGKEHKAPEPPKPKVPKITEEGTLWAESTQRLLELRYGKHLAMFKATAQELTQWENHMVLDKLLSVGMISEKEHADMIRKGRHHIPLYKVRQMLNKSGAVNPRIDDSVYKVLDYLKHDISHKTEDPINAMLRRAAGIEMLTMRQHAKNVIGQRILTDVKWWASDYEDSPFSILSFKEEINKDEFEELQKSGEFVVTSTTKYKKDDQGNRRESGKHYYKHVPYKAEDVEAGLKRITGKNTKEVDKQRSLYEQTIFAFYPEPGKPMYVIISDPSLAKSFFYMNNSQAMWQDSVAGKLFNMVDSMEGADPSAELQQRMLYHTARLAYTGYYGFNRFAKSAITSALSFVYNAIFRDLASVVRSTAGLKWKDIPQVFGEAGALLFPSLMEIHPEKWGVARDAAAGMATFSGLAATNLKGDLDAEVLFSLTRGRGNLMEQAKAGSYTAVAKLMWSDMKQFFAKEGLTVAPGQMVSEIRRGKNIGKHLISVAASPINVGIAAGQMVGTLLENTTRLAERKQMMAEDMSQYPTLVKHYDPKLAINGKIMAGFTGSVHRFKWDRAKAKLAKDPNYKVPEDALPVQVNMTERDYAMNHITIHFAQKGQYTASMDQHTMFFNPMAQDFYTNIMILARHSALQKAVAKALGNDYKAAKNQVRLDAAAHAWVVKSLFYTTMPALLMLAAYGGDDDESKEWQAQSFIEKMSYFWLPTDRIGLTENPIRIASGLGMYSLFFKDLPMAFYLDVMDKDPKAMSKWGQRFFDSTPFGMVVNPWIDYKENGAIAGAMSFLSKTVPVLGPESVNPLAELAIDREAYRDKAIAFPQALAREDPSEVQREKHNMFVNAVTKAFSSSKLQPAQVKYLINRYTPGSSKWVPTLVNKAMEAYTGVEGIPEDVQPSNSPVAGQSPGWLPRWQAREAWGMGNEFVQDLLSTARDATEQMRSYEQIPDARKPTYLADHPLIQPDIFYGKKPVDGFRSGGLEAAAKKVIEWDKDKKAKLKAGKINETEAMFIERQYTLFAMEAMRNVVFQLGE